MSHSRRETFCVISWRTVNVSIVSQLYTVMHVWNKVTIKFSELNNRENGNVVTVCRVVISDIVDVWKSLQELN